MDGASRAPKTILPSGRRWAGRGAGVGRDERVRGRAGPKAPLGRSGRSNGEARMGVNRGLGTASELHVPSRRRSDVGVSRDFDRIPARKCTSAVTNLRPACQSVSPGCLPRLTVQAGATERIHDARQIICGNIRTGIRDVHACEPGERETTTPCNANPVSGRQLSSLPKFLLALCRVAPPRVTLLYLLITGCKHTAGALVEEDLRRRCVTPRVNLSCR